MAYIDKARASLIGAALLALCAIARPAHASSDYPPALKDALDKEFPDVNHCVPLCTACHKTTQGGPGNINVFGSTLERSDIGLVQGDASRVAPAIHNLALAMPPIDSDGDGVSDIDEINTGDSPSIAGPAGDSQFCPDTTYGCGAHIAARPPSDGWSLIPAGLVALGLLAVRRRKVRPELRR
ncbi:MAG TPA: hypothetical protein VGM44_16435 [Polyangiaceae bacterium]|jgi:hypothetical protein